MGGSLVSVIIPVCNKLSYTRACLDALRHEARLDPTYELIVVDDGSTDGTPAHLRSLTGVQVVRNHVPSGFAPACNHGAAQARGEFLVFLNNDTVPQPGWLSALLEPARTDSSIGIVGSRLLYPDGSVQHAGVVFARSAYYPIIPLHIYKGARADVPHVNRTRDFMAVTGACMLVNRELFRDLGGFDEAYKNEFEDVDFCLRARERDFRVVYSPKSVVIHHEMQTRGYPRNDANLVLLNRRWGTRISPDYRRHLAEDGRTEWKLTALSAGAHYAEEQTEAGDTEFIRLLDEVPAGHAAIFKEFRCYRDLERIEPILRAALGRVLSSPKVPEWARGRRKAFQAELLLTLAKMHYLAGRAGEARNHFVEAITRQPSVGVEVLWLLVRSLLHARLRVLWGRGVRNWLQYARN